MGPVEIDDDTRHRWLTVIQPHAHAQHAAHIHRDTLLLRAGESARQNQHQTVRMNRGFNPRGHGSAQRHFNRDIRSYLPHLQISHVGGPASRALRRYMGHHERKHAELFPTSHHTSSRGHLRGGKNLRPTSSRRRTGLPGFLRTC
jgi:hypothetical protein